MDYGENESWFQPNNNKKKLLGVRPGIPPTAFTPRLDTKKALVMRAGNLLTTGYRRAIYGKYYILEGSRPALAIANGIVLTKRRSN